MCLSKGKIIFLSLKRTKCNYEIPFKVSLDCTP